MELDCDGDSFASEGAVNIGGLMRPRLTATACALALLVADASAPAHATVYQRHGELRAVAKPPSGHCKKRNRASGTIRIGGEAGEFILGAPLNFGLLEGLFRYDSRGRLFPLVAASMPSTKNGGIRDHGRTIVIRFKRNLRWSNNREITSSDLLFGWKVDAEGGGCAGSCDDIYRIDTPDRYTAILHLHHIFPAQISQPFTALGGGGSMPDLWPDRWPGMWDRNPHQANLKLFHDPNAYLGPGYPSNGPYEIASVQNGTAHLRPMPYYDNMACGGSVKSIVYNGNLASDAARISAATTGRTDVTVDYTPQALPQLSRRRAGLSLHLTPGLFFQTITFNVDHRYRGKLNPLSNAPVRLALALATDKTAGTQVAIPGNAAQTKRIEAWSPWVNTKGFRQPFANKRITGQWDPLAHRFTSDTGHGTALSDARKILAKTVWRHGFKLDFYTPRGFRDAVSKVLARSWKKLGVKVNRFVVPLGRLFGNWASGGILVRGAFQASLVGYSFANADPDVLRTTIDSHYIARRARVPSDNDQNVAGIADRTIDRAMEAAARTYNSKTRQKDYSTVQLRLNQKAYLVPLWFQSTISTSNRHIRNFSDNPVSAWSWNAYNWKVRKGR